MAVFKKCDRKLLQSVTGTKMRNRKSLHNMTGISTCDNKLLKSVTFVTKCDNYYKVRSNKVLEKLVFNYF